MVAEEADNLCIAYNLITEGDTVLAVTVRKVLRETASGDRDSERVKLKLEIPVEVLLLMRNLSINLTSPSFEDHRRLFSSYEIESEKENDDDTNTSIHDKCEDTSHYV